MAANTNPSDMTAPGSAVYDSKVMYVGDGTWDTKLNTFLLPNLQALNFDTLRYNGMGNRFSTRPDYIMLIKAHGILAAITFLFIVPFAILFLRFYRGSSRLAIRVHMWCQVLTLLLTTSLFALGYLAVGPTRNLTNPHHAVGTTIYVLILFQFFLGFITYRRERKRKKSYAPVKALLHRWIGRAIGLMALAQVPMGLALYGSPAWLFILYGLVVFVWLVLYFVHSFVEERDRSTGHGSEYSYHYGDGSHVSRRKTGRFGNMAKMAAGGAGVAYLANRFRHRNEAPPPSHHSGSRLHASEKYSDDYSSISEKKSGRFGKLLGLGAAGGGLAYAFSRFRGKKQEGSVDSASYTTYSTEERTHGAPYGPPGAHGASYGPPGSHGAPYGPPGAPNPYAPGPYAPGTYPSAIPPGAAAPGAPLMTGAAAMPAAAAIASHRRQDSVTSYSSDDDYSSASPSHKRRNHGIRDTIMGLGAAGIARKLFTNRKAKKEEARIHELRMQEEEEERLNRANSERLRKNAAEGFSRPGDRRNSLTNTDLTPIETMGGPMATGSSAVVNQQATYTHPAYGGGATADGTPLPVVGPPPRDHSNYHSSGSELYTAPDGTPHHRRHGAGTAAAAGLTGAAAGMAASEAIRSRRERSETRYPAGDGPPVSVKLNMHNDGRHVTLRRLTEEEAAADRRRRQGGSSGNVSGAEGDARWRREEYRPPADEAALERQRTQRERERLQASASRLNAPPAGAMPPVNIPPPPPIPHSEPLSGSATSPAATDASTNYELNRKRRRAERAASGGNRQRVEFD